ncbi:YtxH domain-containing protein [Leifsonia sp. L25]|uniref:YtxH domain-containing protein n=1 Tax=Leifsonia sp. L25 TaxID=3423957 RepID=UPI003D694DAC
MRGKILFVTGAAVGYVLGARAGRQRYEQIKAAAAKVWESPAVQKQVHSAQDFVSEKVGEFPETVYITIKRLVVQANDRRREAARTVSVARRGGRDRRRKRTQQPGLLTGVLYGSDEGRRDDRPGAG